MRLSRVCALLIAIALLAGCAAGRAFTRGERRARAGDWDAAVTYYKQAVQHDPNNPDYRIALERASLAASRAHFDAARQLSWKVDQLGRREDRVQENQRLRSGQSPGGGQSGGAGKNHPRPPRGVPAETRIGAGAGAGPDSGGATGAESGIAGADRRPLHAGRVAGHPDVHLQHPGNAIIYDASFDSAATSVYHQLHRNTLRKRQVLNTVLSANQLFYSVRSRRAHDCHRAGQSREPPLADDCTRPSRRSPISLRADITELFDHAHDDRV